MEINYINTKKFKTDDLVAIAGTLKLNSTDVMHFNYTLSDCKIELIK